MKIVKLSNGRSEKMYKPHEAAAMLGYHARTIRRFIQSGRIKAVDSNKNGKQPVWWISQKEIDRVSAEYTGTEQRQKVKQKTVKKPKAKK